MARFLVHAFVLAGLVVGASACPSRRGTSPPEAARRPATEICPALPADGSAEVVVEGPGAETIALGERDAVWTTRRTLHVAPLRGGPPRTLYESPQVTDGGIGPSLLVDAGSAYFTDGPPGGPYDLLRVPLAGGTPLRVMTFPPPASGEQPRLVALDGEFIVLAEGPHHGRVPKRGGDYKKLPEISDRAQQVVALADGLYWGVVEEAGPGASVVTVHRMRRQPRKAEAVTTISTTVPTSPDSPVVAGLAVEGETLFVALVNGEIFAAPLGGGDSKLIKRVRGGVDAITVTPSHILVSGSSFAQELGRDGPLVEENPRLFPGSGALALFDACACRSAVQHESPHSSASVGQAMCFAYE